MTDLREAAQMALEALEYAEQNHGGDDCYFDAIEALRAALANEFNPDWDAMAVMVEEQQRMAKRIEELESALAQPEREWQGLTPEEAREISLANRPYVIDMVYALEAKLKEKNT